MQIKVEPGAISNESETGDRESQGALRRALTNALVAAGLTRHKGYPITSLFLSIVAWLLLGFVLFVLFV
jgi:hypothetical protein